MTQIPPTQGAARETDFVRQTAEEVERRGFQYKPLPYVTSQEWCDWANNGSVGPEPPQWRYPWDSSTEGR